MASAFLIRFGNGLPPWQNYPARVAEVDGEFAGYLVTREVAPGEYEVLHIEVEPRFRRQGIAESLLREAITAATEGIWFLEVRESNVAAHNLYKKLGFIAVGQRAGYYPTGPGKKPETGIVFELQKR